MTESLEDFVTASIIQELSKHYTVEYSQTMFANIPYYTDAKTVLVRNHYKVIDSVDGFSIKKGNEDLGTFNFGPFSAPFLNVWVADSGLDGVAGFPVFFNRTDARRKQGALAACSPKLKEEQKANFFTAAQSDARAIELFRSDKVVRNVRDEKGVQELFIHEHCEVYPMMDFLSEDENGEGQFVDFSDEGNEVPFYYAISMRRRGKPLASVPALWAKKIDADGLTWAYQDGVLYVSNTIGASYGLPPAPAHLRLKNLALSVDDWENIPSQTESVAEETEKKTIGPKEKTAPASTAGGWEELLEQFFAEPCEETYKIVMSSTEANLAFLSAKDTARYKMGSNKNSQSGAIRKKILGESNAVTFEEYSKIISDTAMPCDNTGKLVLLNRLKGLIRINGDELYAAFL